MPARIDFFSRFASPETLVVCVLIEGVPIVLVPGGITPTATAVSSGTVDALWWPGTGNLTYAVPGDPAVNPVRAWLDPSTQWEVYRQVRPLEGDAEGEALTFQVHDPDGAATAVLSGPRARTGQLLTATISASATSIPLDSTSGLASSGIAWIGREAIVYDGVGGSALLLSASPARRAAFGSRARTHRYDSTRPPLVTFGLWPRYLYGRLTTVWLARLSGTTLYDPTLIFAGTIGPGVQRAGKKWSIPVDPLSEVLTRKLAPRTVQLYGYAHPTPGTSVYSPLSINAQGLDARAASPHESGWHASRDLFLARLRALFSPASTAIGPLTTDGRVSVRDTTGGGDMQILAAWHNPSRVMVTRSGGIGQWTSTSRMPSSCLHLHGTVHLPTPGDASSIPTTTVNRSTFALIADTAHTKGLVASVVSVEPSATVPYCGVLAQLDVYDADSASDPSPLQRATLITERTTATIGVIGRGDAVTALNNMGTMLDDLDGGLHVDAFDWDAIGRAFSAAPLGTIPDQREYLLSPGKDTVLTLLTHEARLRAMALCTRNGRISVYRTAVFASTEETTATIVGGDQVAGIEPEVIDSVSPVATSVSFEMRDRLVRWVDEGARTEFGDGADVECRALMHVPFGTDLAGIEGAIQTSAQQVLGVLAEPYRLVRVTLGPRFLGLQEGDIVLFSHPRVPTLTGTIGVTEQVAQAQEVRTQVLGGVARAIVALRLQEPDLAGYAPSALVAASGLSVSGGQTTLTLDTTTGFGSTCFARATRPDGTAATSATDGFTAGDRVVLSQYDSRTPIADEVGTIVTVSDTSMVIDIAASASMISAAAAQYGVIVRFADWTVVDALTAVVRDRQERYLYVALASSGVLGAGDSPKRWAA